MEIKSPNAKFKIRDNNWRYYKERAIARKEEKQKYFSQNRVWKSYDPKESTVQLSPQQLYVLELIRKGKSVFYTGSAGTGKTTLLKEIVKCSPEGGSFVTALTGVAAIQVSGTTLHSFAGIGLGNGTADSLLQMVKRGHKKINWRRCKVLIVDEVSMLSADLFDKLEYIARKMKENSLHFGGIQLVLCGDFFQLPPITKPGQAAARYCFQSQKWQKCMEHSIELTQIYRQSDPKLIRLLNEVRFDNLSEFSNQLLNSLKRTLPKGAVEPTKLHSHNVNVNEINNRFLDQLPGEEMIYTAVDKGRDPYKSDMNKYCTAMDRLVLKQNAQVMLLKNIADNLVNGSRGVVVGFEDMWPQVLFANGVQQTIQLEKWDLEDRNGNVLASRKQIPLKLAWAITIHKSQGMSIDLLQVDLNHVFSQGQAYVALSRARTLEGLQVLSYDKEKFWTNREVIKFYKNEMKPAEEINVLSSDEEQNEVFRKSNSVQIERRTQFNATSNSPSKDFTDSVRAGNDYFDEPSPTESCVFVNGATSPVNLKFPSNPSAKRPTDSSNLPPFKKTLFNKNSPGKSQVHSSEYPVSANIHSNGKATPSTSSDEMVLDSSQDSSFSKSNYLSSDCFGADEISYSQRSEAELAYSKIKSRKNRLGVSVSTQTNCTCRCSCGSKMK